MSDYTPEDRRLVAEALRDAYAERCANFEPQDVGAQAVGYLKDLIDCLPEGKSAFTVLADLIDPTTTADFNAPWRTCGKCGGKFAGYNIKPVRFCPHCGRRIVEGP